MAAQGTTSNAGEFKHVYSPEIIDYVVEKYAKFVNFVGGLKGEDTDIGDGFYWRVPVQSGWNVGVTSEGGVFPTPSTNTDIQPYTKLGQAVAAINYTLMLKEVGRGRGVWEDSVKRQMNDALLDVVSLLDRYMAGGSGDGILATVNANTSSSTSFVCKLPFGDLLLEEGMKLQIHDNSSTEREDNTKITKIVRGTRTVTVDIAQTLTANDSVFISLGAASGGTQGLSTHVNGLGNLVSDSGTVHNINRSTYELWKANVLSNGGTLRNLSEDILNEAFMVTDTRAKAARSGQVDVLAMNRGQIFKYYQHVRPDRRIPVSGSGVPSYNTGSDLKPSFYYDRAIPLEVFAHIKPRTVYGLVKSNLARIGKARPEFLDAKELGLTSSARNTTEEMFLVWFLQFISKRMNNAFRIDDLSDPIHCGAPVGGSDS